MALPIKPDMTHVWASGGAKVAPGDTKIDTGWTAEVPPFQWENWSQNRQDAFLDHINKSGFPVWDGLTNYESAGQSLTKGSDGKIYKSVAASGPSTTIQDPVTDTTDTYWTIAFADVGAFLTQAAGDARYTQRSNNLSDLTNAATARDNLGVTNAVEGGLQNTVSNLVITTTGLSAVIAITADAICVKNSAFQQKVLNNVSLPTVSFNNAGVNGLDTGVGGSQTASAWYYIFVIWNGTTTAGLLSLSLTNPILPSGYTHKAFVGAIRTDGTTNKFPLKYLQNNDIATYTPLAGTNTPVLPVIFTGTLGTAPSTWGAMPLGSFVPPNAMDIGVVIFSQNNASLAPNSNYGQVSTNINPPPYQWIPPATTSKSDTMRFVIEGPNLYGIFTTSISSVGALSWRLRL